MFRLLLVLTGCSIIAATRAYYGALELGTSALKEINEPQNRPRLPVLRKLAPNEPPFADGDAITQQAVDHVSRDMENYLCTVNCEVEPEVDPLGTAVEGETTESQPLPGETTPAEPSPIGRQ